jgi:hypothetical protein
MECALEYQAMASKGRIRAFEYRFIAYISNV